MVARSSRVIPTFLRKALGKPGAFFNYKVQITNDGEGRDLVEVTCARLVACSFAFAFCFFLTAENTE